MKWRKKMILVTGGTGYLGSHSCVELIQQGYEIAVVDNLCNSSLRVIDRIKEITGKAINLYQCDLRDYNSVEKIFLENKIDACIHFAGLKSVEESMQKPVEYYDNNITGTLSLIKLMKKYDVKNLVFSSSATVYGEVKKNPIDENVNRGKCKNPYGWTKSMIEQILEDLYDSDPAWNIILLRYFNPIGAHYSGLIGEDPKGRPNNIMPYITQVALGKLEKFYVLGNDYDTPDGTGVRDYIHVLDLACAHVKSLLQIERKCGFKVYNVGTGRGYSVLELIKTFEEVTGIKIPYVIKPRRKGDVPICYCNPLNAEKDLDWKAKYNLRDMCRDAWKWQIQNPNGY